MRTRASRGAAYQARGFGAGSGDEADRLEPLEQPARLATPQSDPHRPERAGLRLVRELDTGYDDPEMHFTVGATVPEVLDQLRRGERLVGTYERLREQRALLRCARGNDAIVDDDLEGPAEEDLQGGNAFSTRRCTTEYGAIPALYLASTDDAHPAPMGTGAPTFYRPSSPRGVRRRHVLRTRRMLVFACIAAEAWFVSGAGPADHTIGEKCDFTGALESSVVPAGICRIRIEAVGAAGGGEGTAVARGQGVHAVARTRVAPTEILRVRIRGLRGAAVATSALDAVRHGGVAADGAGGHHGDAGSAAQIPEDRNNGIRDRTADAAHPVPATPSPAAVTAFYRRAQERTAKLMGKPAPKWRACPSCKLAFHGPNTLPENPATGHTPGDWQP